MANRSLGKRKPSGKKGRRGGRRGALPQTVAVRQTRDGQTWELVHPRCAAERAEDLDEVHEMLAAGEVDVAVDELHWLVSECADFIEAHCLLGELALDDDDLPLARGHLGAAYQLGLRALRRAGSPGPLPYRLPANQGFFTAGRGLAMCLIRLERPDLAREILGQLLDCDPTDPLELRAVQATLDNPRSEPES